MHREGKGHSPPNNNTKVIRPNNPAKRILPAQNKTPGFPLQLRDRLRCAVPIYLAIVLRLDLKSACYKEQLS